MDKSKLLGEIHELINSGMVYVLIFVFIAGFLLGVIVSSFMKFFHGRAARELAENQMEMAMSRLKEAFGELSVQALSRSTDEFLKLARSRFEAERQATSQELEGKKALIDQKLEEMASKLENVSRLIKELEKDREKKFGELAGKLSEFSIQTAELVRTAGSLKEVLASSKARGQWGERMAEDILQAVGLVEGINYKKQSQTANGTRPDFAFFLPRGLVLNMDVKFPFDNYVRYMESPSEQEKESFAKAFIRDVRNRIKEVASREYIDPEQGTVDYALLFIPNEQVFSFIQEKEPGLLDEALSRKVIFCSPTTLFAVLAVVRQAVENFALQQASKEILALFGRFKAEWEKFLDRMDKLGKRIKSLQDEYDSLVNSRRKGLERVLDKIDQERAMQALVKEGANKSLEEEEGAEA